jgi:phosphate transport system substrate-binding protein
VAGQVRQTPGAIGYIELAYVLQNEMTYARIQNKAGNYVYPSVATAKAAAASKPEVSPTDFSIVDAGGADSYPICGYSWALLYKNPADPARGAQLKTVMQWLVTKGQADAESIDYVPLPENVQQEALKTLAGMGS